MKNKYKALIKDLEAQIDFLIGYSPSNLHWKQEGNIRAKMIDEALFSDYLPEESRTKILVIQDKIQQIRDGVKQEQPYWSEVQFEPLKRKIKVRDWRTQEEYYI